MIWLLLLVGLALGPAINFAIYGLAYFSLPISPWQSKPKTMERDGKSFPSIKPSALAKLPILGWLTRSNEKIEFGRWFWIRPMLIEILTPCVLILLYRFVLSEGLVPSGGPPIANLTLVKSFVSVAMLIVLLTIATFIDFDERMIPDSVTVPGTLFGLIGGAFFPDWRLRELMPVFPAYTDEVHANSPWLIFSASWIQGAGTGLILALMFWLGWCFALLDRAWITRRGWERAWVYFWAIIFRSPSTKWIGGMAAIGSIAIIIAHSLLSADGWEGLVTSLFGIALGGVLVWSFRIVAAVVMGREALGFGDVTLMAMVGSIVGWQVVWLGFFLAPFFGMIFVVTMWIITRDSSTPFGPYLSMGVIFTVLSWSTIWPSVEDFFFPPQMMGFILLGLLVALALSLAIVQSIKKVVGTSIE